MPRPLAFTRAFWTDRAAWTARAYGLQQRLAVTRAEATALLALTGLLVLGLGVRAWQAHQAPYDAAFYAETDAAFAALAAAPTAPFHVAAAPDTLNADSSRTEEAAAAPSGAVASAGEGDPPPAPAPRRAGPVRMNVNTASAALLDRLPGIGPALAGRIVDYREAHGPFRRAEDLVNVRGIGAKTFAKMAPYVFVEAPVSGGGAADAAAGGSQTEGAASDATLAASSDGR